MLALLRVQNIEIGIVSALLLNILLWPYHAKIQLTVSCAKATDRLIKLYLSMSKYATPSQRTSRKLTSLADKYCGKTKG